MTSRRFVVFATLLAAALLWPAVARAQSNTPQFVWWEIIPNSPCADDTVRLRIGYCSDCVYLLFAGRNPQTGGLEIDLQHGGDSCFVYNCEPADTIVTLGRFQPGQHMLLGNLLVRYPGEEHPRISQFRLDFAVRPDCGGDTPVPYLDRVEITGPNGGPICGGQPITVKLAGRLPSDCHSIRRVELFHPVYAGGGIRPGPPIVRVLVDDGGCLGRPCQLGSFPWTRELTLPPLPPDDSYGLLVETYQTTCSDSFPDQPLGGSSTHFVVQDCGPPAGCLLTKWGGPMDARCDAFVSKLHPARVTLKMQSSVALAGLQGELRMYPEGGLRITGIQPTGAAASMFLSWQLHADGHASFVLFAKDGSTIPAMQPSYQDTLGEPILHVFLETQTRAAIPPVTRLYATELLGSDAAGNGVYPCPVPANVRLDLSATICADRPCDANADGVSDVRDLVRMVICLHDTTCMDSTRLDLERSLDCDGDGHFAIADVICCALAILRNSAPHDPGEPQPHVEVDATLGMPTVAEDGRVTMPVTVRNATSLGAALLRLRFPSGRYTLESVETPYGVARIAFHSREGDEVALALVRLVSDVIPAWVLPPDATFKLHLRLIPGADPAGVLELLDGQFAAVDGSRLAVDVTPASMPIVPPVTATLAPARPNPFSRMTHFSVDLPRAAAVDVTVHDLSGRRVAVLFQGELPAGRREFTWSGAIDRGGRAADGVYFLRLAADGQIVSRKVVVLRSP